MKTVNHFPFCKTQNDYSVAQKDPVLGFVFRLFNDVFLIVQYHWIVWENDREFWIGKELKRVCSALFEDIAPDFV